MSQFGLFRKYGYIWVTLVIFLGSLFGHWMFSWHNYKQEQEEHNQPVIIKDYIAETAQSMLENWQGDFLQLIWQVYGLALLYSIGSPQSKEGDERKEEKIDMIIRLLGKEEGEKEIKRLDKKYARK